MKLKFTYWYMFLFFFLAASLGAQPEGKRERIEALRATYITQKINLTPQEAQAFWPLYNEMNDKLEAARKAFRQQYNKNFNFDTATDKEAEAYVNAEIALRQKEVDLHKEYYEKFKKVLPIKKVARLKHAEDEFRREIIKSIKGNQPE